MARWQRTALPAQLDYHKRSPIMAEPQPSEIPPQADPAAPSPAPEHRLREVAWLFLKLGTIGFGGPAAHTAMMEEETVRRRQWLSRERFLDLLGATNLIPGPNSTELAIHLGYLRAGWPGLIAAGTCFIVPAVVIVTACAWAYGRFGAAPQAAGLLYGVKPVIIAVVAQALWSLGKTAVKSRRLAYLGAASFAACFLGGVNELLILAGAGTFAAVAHRIQGGGPGLPALVPAPIFAGASVAGAAAASATAFGLWPLFLFFLKTGSVLYGSGYVLLVFLRADLVERFGWLTEAQLLDAIAVGQFTPGPLFTTATFVGYLLGGPPGAAVATAGIFLPAFVFVALSGPLVPRLRESRTAGAFLDGINVASLALMAEVSLRLAHAAIMDAITCVLAFAAVTALIRFRINSAWLVLGGMAVGMAVHLADLGA